MNIILWFCVWLVFVSVIFLILYFEGKRDKKRKEAELQKAVEEAGESIIKSQQRKKEEEKKHLERMAIYRDSPHSIIDPLLYAYIVNKFTKKEIDKRELRLWKGCIYILNSGHRNIENRQFLQKVIDDIIEIFLIIKEDKYYDVEAISSIKNSIIINWETDKIKHSDIYLREIFIDNYDEMYHYITTGRKLITELTGKQNIRIDEKARQAHTYIIGASKSGKSELIKDLIFSDFQKGNKSVILIEPHGDLAEQVAKLKDKDNDNLVYIDFTLDQTKTPVLNPFDIVERTPEKIEIQAQALIDAFEDILGAEFSNQMEELLGATIRTLMYSGKGDFWELRRFMDDENNSDLIASGKTSQNPKDRLFFTDGSFNQSSYKPTKNSLKSKIGTYLGYAVFRNFTTGKSTIDLKKLTDGKKWVIFNLSKGNIGKKVSPILGRFIIASLQNIILQRASSTHRTPVYLYIDEFQNYTSETIEEIFSESRKYGFHLTVAHQNTGQLLGKMRDLIFSNTSVKIVGRNDTEQLKKLSNQIIVDFEELDKLITGNFYMRVEKNEAHKIKVGTKLLDNKYIMTSKEWEEVKAQQLTNYYTKIEEREPPKQHTDPTAENFDFNPSDTV